MDRWLYLLWKGEEIDPAEPPAEVAGGEYREAPETTAAYTKSEMARELYLRRLDLQRTMAKIKAEAREAGLAEGRQETAKRLKELGVGLDIIIQATGLSREEIAKL